MRKLRTTGLLLIWTVLALYPNPLMLGRAIGQSWTPVVDADAVRDLAATLPDDPHQIENAGADAALCPTACPGRSMACPGTSPPPAKCWPPGAAIARAAPSCSPACSRPKASPSRWKPRSTTSGSIIPARTPTPWKTRRSASPRKRPPRTTASIWPADWNLQQSWEIERAYFWDVAPTWRLVVLFLGYLPILFRRQLFRRLRRPVAAPVAAQA